MQREITYYLNNYKKAKYNFLGLIPLAMGIRIRRQFKLTCSQFVALVLEKSNEIELPKDPYLMLPNDFSDINNVQLIYDGTLKNCTVSIPIHAKV